MAEKKSRQTAVLLLKEVDGLQHQLGYRSPSASSLPATITPPRLPIGSAPDARLLPPADLLKEFCDRRDAIREAARDRAAELLEEQAARVVSFEALKLKIEARAREIVAAPYWQRSELSLNLEPLAA